MMLNEIKNAAFDAASLVWLELVMFSFAVITYMIFTGGYLNSTTSTSTKGKGSAAADEASPSSRAVRSRATPSPEDRKDEVDVSKHVAMMRARSRENDLEGAMQVFRKLQSSGVQLTSLVYNALLDSCVQCGKVNVALQHFQEIRIWGWSTSSATTRC